MTGEADRIRATYRTYDTDARERAKRDMRNRGNVVIARELGDATANLLKVQFPDLHSIDVLDAGCGSGGFVARLIELGANPSRIRGIDILLDRIESARGAIPNVRFDTLDLRDLDDPDGSYDLVICRTIFSSIVDRQIAVAVARQVARVLRNRGRILWYDSRYDNPSNTNVRGLGRQEIAKLFPGFHIDLRSITVLPPLVRALGPLTFPMYSVLRLAPFLRVRYLGWIWRDLSP